MELGWGSRSIFAGTLLTGWMMFAILSQYPFDEEEKA